MSTYHLNGQEYILTKNIPSSEDIISATLNYGIKSIASGG